MTFSVFAGTIALAGSAAAVSNVSGVSLSPNSAQENSTVTHNLTFMINDGSSDSGKDTVIITLPGAAEFASANSLTLDGNNAIGAATVDNRRITVEGDLDSLDAENDDNIVVDANVDLEFGSVSDDTETDVAILIEDSNSDTVQTATDLFISDRLEPPTDDGFFIDDEFESDEYVVSGGDFYQGQQFVGNGLTPDETLQLYEYDSSEDDNLGAFVRNLEVNDNGQVGIDTSALEDQYVVTNQEENAINFDTNGAGTVGTGVSSGDQFTVELQTLDATFVADSMASDGTIDYTVDSNLDQYVAVQTPLNDDITPEDLNEALSPNGEVVGFDADDEEYVSFEVNRQSSILTFDFDGIDNDGELETATTSVDTGVAASDTVTTGENEDADVDIVDTETGEPRDQIR